MKRTFHIYTVQGITANLCALAKHFGVPYPTAHARLFEHDWSIEEALGLVPRRRKPNANRLLPELVDGPRLGSPADNFLRAALRLLTAEEYLRLEGVPMNEHPLESHGNA